MYTRSIANAPCPPDTLRIVLCIFTNLSLLRPGIPLPSHVKIKRNYAEEAEVNCRRRFRKNFKASTIWLSTVFGEMSMTEAISL